MAKKLARNHASEKAPTMPHFYPGKYVLLLFTYTTLRGKRQGIIRLVRIEYPVLNCIAGPSEIPKCSGLSVLLQAEPMH